MATINFARREIEAKVVYCGPALSGKTTNLKVLHDIVPKGQRGDLHMLDTAHDRTLFFDFIPLELGEIAGFTARFKLFSVPGQKVYSDTRREVLRGADAVVFVADSSPDRVDANVDSLTDLRANLAANGLDLQGLPLVVQLNKRDVPGAQDAEEMARALNPSGAPVIEAVAADRHGVLDTLYKITEIASQRIRENLAGRSAAVKLTSIDRAEAEDDHEVVKEHLGRVHAVRGVEELRAEALKAEEAARPDDLDQFLLEFVDRSDEDAAEAIPVAEADGEDTGDVEPAPLKPLPRRGRSRRVAEGGRVRTLPVDPAGLAEPAGLAASPVADPAAPAQVTEPVVDGPSADLPAVEVTADAPSADLPVVDVMPEPPTATPPHTPRPPPPRPVAAPAPVAGPASPAATPAFAPRPPTPEHDLLPRGLGFEARVRPDALGGGAVREVVAVTRGPGGDTVLDVIVEKGPARTRHPMRIVLGDAPPPPASNVAVLAAGALAIGMLVGVTLVKLGFL